jgi:predicted nucleic acid-binding protein
MTVPVFADTNILLYAEDVEADPFKHRVARDLIRDMMRAQSGHISLQVLQEYFSIATGKLKVHSEVARRRVEYYMTLDVVTLDEFDVLGAIDLHRLHQFSIWDCLILRAALISGCRKLYTEDLQHGFRLERLEVVNPFYGPPPLMVPDR